MKAQYYQSYTDSDLIQLILEDDHQAYMEIYNRYARLLYSYAIKKLPDKDDIKDLLQDIFTALWQNRHSLKIDTPLAGYLYATLRYMVIKRFAHEKVANTYLDSLANASLVDEVQTDTLVRENELRSIIEHEIAAMPKKMQRVFRMSRESHLTHKEIADELGLSESTVKKHVNNALKSLRQKFGTLLSLLYFFLL